MRTGKGDGAARLHLVVGASELKGGSVGASVEALRLATNCARSDELRETSCLELARALERTGAFGDALASLAVLGDSGSPTCLAQRAFLQYRLGDETEAEVLLQRAEAEMPPTPSRDRVRVHNTYGLLLHRQQRRDEARRQFQRAIELAKEAQNPVWEASAQHNLGRVEDDDGRIELGYELFRQSAAMARRYGDRQMGAVFATSEAQSLVDLGRLDEAKHRLQAAREELELVSLGPQFQRPLLTLQSLVAMAEGELEAALENAERSRQMGEDQADDRGVLIADVVRAEVLMRMGESGQARDLCRSLRERLDSDALDEIRDYIDISTWMVGAWCGPLDELAAAVDRSRPGRAASPKRRADIAEARVRAAFVLGRDAEVVEEVASARQELAHTGLDDRLAVLLAMDHASRCRLGESVDGGGARRAADVLVAAGHRARRAEALFRLGVAGDDVPLLEEASRLAQRVRHGPLQAAIAQELGPRSSAPLAGAEASRRLRSLEQLKEVTKAITRELDGERLLRMVLDHAIEHTGAKRGFLILMRGESLSVVAARNIDEADIENPEFSLSSSVAWKVAREGKAVMLSDASTEANLGPASSIAQLKLQSILCVPLQAHEPVSGSVYLDDPTAIDRFGEDDKRYVEDLSDYAAIALEKAQLLKTNLDRQVELEETKREIERLNHQLERTVAAQAQELIEVKESLRATRAELSLKYDYPNIVTRSDKMRKVLELIDRITDSSYPVYLFGESGTGKELIARCLHVNGPRSQGPYFGVNCASFSPTLIETELFGHVKGAFTGADRDKPGVFELADEGTLFLDEISDASLELQAKLLRAIQFGEVMRVGSDEVRRVEVRVVSASNRDLANEVQEGRFREDLFYRLNVHRVELPPLRDRREDVPLLLEHFQTKHAEKLGVSTLRFERSVLRQLIEHEWRGNVRELENCVIDLLVRCSDDGKVTEQRLPPRFRASEAAGDSAVLGDGKGLKALVEEFERSMVVQVLEQCSGIRAKAARQMGMSERNLYKKLGKYGLLANSGESDNEN